MKNAEFSKSLQFEIKFYENLVTKDPDFIDALIALGDAYTRIGKYKKGLEIDKKLARLKRDDETVYYNLACSYALLEMPNEAFRALDKSIDLGYHDLVHLQKDPDLNNIKTDSRFTEIVTQFKKRRKVRPR